MNISNYLLKARSRSMWQDPARKIRTLEGFSQTEIDGGENIQAASKYIVDKKLRNHFVRHAREELRHGMLFQNRAKELREQYPDLAMDSSEPDKLYDLRHARNANELSEVDAHGFFSADKLEEVGEVPYVAMLHVAEKNAAKLFQMHRDLLSDDKKTQEVFDKALNDEKYHVAYTGHYLKLWRQQGRAREVRDALSQARGSRIIGAMRRFGVRSGAHFGSVLMMVVYFLFITPFGLIARLGREDLGWKKPKANSKDQQLTSQF